jgi:hypothetical protein
VSRQGLRALHVLGLRPAAVDRQQLPLTHREQRPQDIGGGVQRPKWRQQAVAAQSFDGRATACAVGTHAVVPRSGSVAVGVAHKQDRANHAMDPRQVVAPEGDVGVQTLHAADLRARLRQALLDAVDFVDMARGRHQQLGPRCEVQVQRLPRHAGGSSDVTHARTKPA